MQGKNTYSKHGRSKSTTTAAVNQQNNSLIVSESQNDPFQEYQQQQYYYDQQFQSQGQQLKQQQQKQPFQYGEKRPLKPKDLNNYENSNSIHQSPTPLEHQDSRKNSQPPIRQPFGSNSYSQQQPPYLLDFNSPEKYLSVQQSRTISHLEEQHKQLMQQQYQQQFSSSTTSTSSHPKQKTSYTTKNASSNPHTIPFIRASQPNTSSNNSKYNTSNSMNPNASKDYYKNTSYSTKHVSKINHPATQVINPYLHNQNATKKAYYNGNNNNNPNVNQGSYKNFTNPQLNSSFSSSAKQQQLTPTQKKQNPPIIPKHPQTRQRSNNSVSSSSQNVVAAAMQQYNYQQAQQFSSHQLQSSQPLQIYQQYPAQNLLNTTYNNTRESVRNRQPQQTQVIGDQQQQQYHYRSSSHSAPNNLLPYATNDFALTNPQYFSNTQTLNNYQSNHNNTNNPINSSMLSVSFNHEDDTSFVRYPLHQFILDQQQQPQIPVDFEQQQISQQINAGTLKLPQQQQQQQQLPFNQRKHSTSQINVDHIYTDPAMMKFQLALENEKAVELLVKGKQAFKENNITEALKLFADSIKQEPNLLESQYLLGVCYLSTNNYENAIQEFCDLLEKNEYFKRNVFLLIAIAYKKTNVINAAIQILGKAIQQYPKYYDAYIYRGKLQVKMKRFDKALSDFDTAIKLSGSCGLGYMGKADCLRFMGEFQKAIDLYTEAFQKEEIIAKVAVLKRAITYIEAKQYDQAQIDLAAILQDDPGNSEAFYFKGLLYYKQKNVNEALLSFEQAIKHNNSRKAVTKALYEIAKIKIELRDFYQAYHTLQRAEYLDVDMKSLEKFMIFTDGVTFLMKRKHKEGVQDLTNLVKNHNLGDFLKPLVYTYRAYGYFCLGKHQKCLNDLQLLETFSKLDKTAFYNKYLCEGIISASNNQFESAINFFSKANKNCPNKMEPFFYKAMTLIRFANKLIPKSDEAKHIQQRTNALKQLDKGVELNNVNSNLFYHRGIIRLSLGKVEESIADFNLAIEKSEDTQAKHNYARGLAYGMCHHWKQAIYDISYAIDQQPTLSNAYLNRAKCFLLIGDKNSSFADLQQYNQIKHNDPDIHLYTGHMLFNIGEYADALKTYQNAEQTVEILLLKAHCNILLKKLDYALQDLDAVIAAAQIKKLLQLGNTSKYDKICLQSLKVVSQAAATTDQLVQLAIFKDALNTISQTKVLKKKINNKIEGTCFKRSDYLLFKGVYCFYLKDYQKALKKFKQSFELKSELINKPKPPEKTNSSSDQQKNENIEDLDEEGINHQAQLLNEYEFTNRTYNVFEFYFNCAACYIMMKDYDQAFSFLLQLQAILPEEEEIIKRIEILFQIINDEQEQSRATFEKIDEAALNDINNLEFFPKNHRLCSIFPSVSTDFKIYKDFKINLYFCLPTVDPPSMKPHFDESLLEGLQPTVVENKPEAPWIRRTSEGIIFTDNVQIFEDLDLKTETARESDAGAEAQQKLDEATAGEQQENIIDSQKFQVDLKDKANAAEYKNQRDNNNAVPSRGRKNEFDYVELMNDHSHYLYQDYKDIDYSCDGEEAVFKNSPQQIEKDKLKEFLKLDDNIEKKLAKLQQKNQKQ